MDDQACPKCKTTKYRNPSLKLLVNVCGHALCDNCVELLFVKGSGSCPVCNVPLRRNNFRVQIFEDPVVEKEMDIRKKVLRDFNKQESDFANLREFNDYLEEVENIIYNLTHNISVESTKQSIEVYKKENKAIIQKNKSKPSRDLELIEQQIEAEQMESSERQKRLMEEKKEEKRLKVKNRENLIDELAYSDAPAGHILTTHANIQKQMEKPIKPLFKSTYKPTQREIFDPIPKDETPLFQYEDIEMEFSGPDVPQNDQLETEGFLKHIRCANGQEKGGGFESNLACMRALQEAMSGLYNYV